MTIKALKEKTHVYKLNRSISNGVVMLRTRYKSDL
jgi:hypothetical protein